MGAHLRAGLTLQVALVCLPYDIAVSQLTPNSITGHEHDKARHSNAFSSVRSISARMKYPSCRTYGNCRIFRGATPRSYGWDPQSRVSGFSGNCHPLNQFLSQVFAGLKEQHVILQQQRRAARSSHPSSQLAVILLMSIHLKQYQ